MYIGFRVEDFGFRIWFTFEVHDHSAAPHGKPKFATVNPQLSRSPKSHLKHRVRAQSLKAPTKPEMLGTTPQGRRRALCCR